MLATESMKKRLTEHVRMLTNFADLSSLANTQVEEVFVTRVLEERNFWSAAQYMMDMKQEISETSVLKQVNLLLHRLYPLVESPENLKIISIFCSDPTLYGRIPDLLQCIVTTCVRGTIESTVESNGSKMEHHNIEGRRITTEHLNEEVFVAWNDPEI